MAHLGILLLSGPLFGHSVDLVGTELLLILARKSIELFHTTTVNLRYSFTINP